MKKYIKIFVIATIIINMLFVFSIQSFALTSFKNMIEQTEQEKPYGQDGGKATTTTKSIVGSIISVMRIIGVGVAIVMLVVVAIKFMLSAPNDRAEIKKHAVVYVIGAVVLFASSGLLGLIAQFAGNM